ncbi:hypothetical protein EWB00_001630 [Schistosoma japonicum]|uniref:Uncharacterized protein n=1 Tax=Schistosoma japonicum TaxID=6182 RepID=A0A4Z2CJW5_SCHJA|nr:hypothetical protein EWB00_001630 [Schistosoma japonicum]
MGDNAKKALMGGTMGTLESVRRVSSLQHAWASKSEVKGLQLESECVKGCKSQDGDWQHSNQGRAIHGYVSRRGEAEEKVYWSGRIPGIFNTYPPTAEGGTRTLYQKGSHHALGSWPVTCIRTQGMIRVWRVT